MIDNFPRFQLSRNSRSTIFQNVITFAITFNKDNLSFVGGDNEYEWINF